MEGFLSKIGIGPNRQQIAYFEKTRDLIESGDFLNSVNSDYLKRDLNAKLITKDQYNRLVSQLLAKQELIQSYLAPKAKELSTTVSELQTTVSELQIDTVTGLMKHEALGSKLNELIKELNSTHYGRKFPLRALLVVALDLDNLREWNKKGHPVGDEALRTLIRGVKRATREEDYLFRRGDKSDEIIVILRIQDELDDDKLIENVERIKVSANSNFIEIGGVKLPVTASVGYEIVRPGELRKAEDILGLVDAKESENKNNPALKEQRIREATMRLN